jgi:predicted amidohydrolase YtcJ
VTHEYTILHGGLVVTLDGAAPTDAASRAAGLPDAAGRRATAIAFAHDRIIAVGSDADIVALAGSDSRVVDLGGRVVVPGFRDPHAHPIGEGVDASKPLIGGETDLRGGLRVLSDAASRLPPDAWLLARYDQTGWRGGRHPTRDDLDRAIPDRPVLLAHVSGHAVAANSLALAFAGVSAATDDIPGRRAVERDEGGEPTGVVTGTDAWDLFVEAVPAPAHRELIAAVARAAARLVADGVVATADADLGSDGTGIEPAIAAYVAAASSGRLPLPVALMPGLVRLGPADADPPSPGDLAASIPGKLRERLPMRAAKLKADGAMTTRTAWLREDYADAPGWRGLPVGEPGALAERIRRAHLAGWRTCTHAIGDAAVDAVLDALDALAAADPATRPVAERRHRIEHAMLLDDAAIARIARVGAVASMQPEFVAWAGDTYRARLGAERAARMNRYRSLLGAGVPVAFGSDRPVVGGRPLDGIAAAVRHAGPSGTRLSDVESVSPAEALHAWTAGAAFAMGDEADGGRLAVGMRADLVILSADPTVPAVPGRRGSAVRVLATVVGGRAVHGDIA